MFCHDRLVLCSFIACLSWEMPARNLSSGKAVYDSFCKLGKATSFVLRSVENVDENAKRKENAKTVPGRKSGRSQGEMQVYVEENVLHEMVRPMIQEVMEEELTVYLGSARHEGRASQPSSCAPPEASCAPPDRSTSIWTNSTCSSPDQRSEKMGKLVVLTVAWA